MSQELVSVKKQITFEELCPRWSKLIHRLSKTSRTRFIVEHKVIDIMTCKRCVVGEAHGFKDDYWMDCSRCGNYSGRFASLLTKTPAERRTSIERFVNHFNKYHS